MATDMLFFGFYYQQVSLFLALSIFFSICSPSLSSEHFHWLLLTLLLYRTHTNSIWLLENWRSSHGDFTGGTILGSKGMWNHKLQLMSMSGDPMCTSISMSQMMAQDGMWALLLQLEISFWAISSKSSRWTIFSNIFTFRFACLYYWSS
jgi:hypothetical protein